MKTKGLGALLAFAVIALTVLASFQHRTIRELRSHLQQMRQMQLSQIKRAADMFARPPPPRPEAAVTR